MPVAVDLRKPNRVSDGGTLALLHCSGLLMPIAGRLLRASCPSLTRCWLRFGILPALASNAGSRARAAPRFVFMPP